MREIKLRVWDVSDERMYYNVTNISDINGYIMQWTGLLDKNGREIYEGDILKNNYGDLWVVVWNGTRFRLALFGDSKGIYSANEYYFSGCEVIGNIYQNPEILEAKGNE